MKKTTFTDDKYNIDKNIEKDSGKIETNITTIKISKKTKERLDHLKEYKRESYEEIVEKMLKILNICRISPIQARQKLVAIDRKRKDSTRRL